MPPSVPERLRDVYVIGRMGSYFLPTLAKCEALINQMTQLARSSECRNDPKLKARVEWDRDQVIDRWSVLSMEFHEQTALKASR